MIFILLFGFCLRLIGINQSLWLDEAISANVVKMPIYSIVNNFSIYDFHPPLYYWFLHVWQNIFGSGVVQMRLSSVIFSTITIWLVFLIGKNIFNKNNGIWGAILVAINPLLIYYSQELRMYSMAVMWLTLAIYFYIKIILSIEKKDKNEEKIKNNWIYLIGFNMAIFLAFMTYYGSIFIIGTMIVTFLFRKKFKLFFISSVGILLAVLLGGSLLLSQIKYSGDMLSQVTNWSLVLGKVNLKNLILIPFKFSIGRISWYPKYLYYLIGGIWTVFVWVLVGKQILKNKFFGSLLIVPIIFGIIFSIKSPLLQYFRFLYLIPILALLLAKIDNQIIRKILFVGFLGFSLGYLLNPQMHREDWKSLTNTLNNNQKVYMIASFSDPIKFYNSTIEIEDIKTSEPQENKILLIPYGGTIHGIDTNKKMAESGYKINEIKNFREVTLEFWEKR